MNGTKDTIRRRVLKIYMTPNVIAHLALLKTNASRLLQVYAIPLKPEVTLKRAEKPQITANYSKNTSDFGFLV